MSKKYDDKLEAMYESMRKTIPENVFAGDDVCKSERKVIRKANINLLEGAVHYAKYFDTGEVPDPQIAVFAKCYSCMYKSGKHHNDCPDVTCPLNPITFGCLYMPHF